jgi:hypothetical protein
VLLNPWLLTCPGKLWSPFPLEHFPIIDNTGTPCVPRTCGWTHSLLQRRRGPQKAHDMKWGEKQWQNSFDLLCFIHVLCIAILNSFLAVVLWAGCSFRLIALGTTDRTRRHFTSGQVPIVTQALAGTIAPYRDGFFGGSMQSVPCLIAVAVHLSARHVCITMPRSHAKDWVLFLQFVRPTTTPLTD